jgi:SAM-dependent methyltransferase
VADLTFGRKNSGLIGPRKSALYSVPMQTVFPTFDASYWQGRYVNGYDGWDAHGITPPLQSYFDQLDVRQQPRILIPGAGRAYEAEYLHRAGFRYVVVADLVREPLVNLVERVPDFPKAHLLLSDFFKLPTETPYDLIVEQTFFCALNPSLRSAYARQCAALLRPGGTLMGLLFETEFVEATEPPFGGHRNEYREYFEPYFEFLHFDTATNSLPPRQGRELFICLKKK